MTDARIQTPRVVVDEDELERTLRPPRLDEFIGQRAVKDQISVSLEAAIARGEALDHVLLSGPPGLGKTSLARILAAELGVAIVPTAGPALERKGDLAAYLSSLEPGSIFFIDEIHRLPRALEETLYPAMEDGELPITVGQGAGAQVVTLPLPPFTLVGATTRAGLLSTPLRDRFGIQHRLDPYELDDLAAIVRRSAAILGADVDDPGTLAIARRSRGTPRVANRLLKRVRDYAEVRHSGAVTSGIAAEALELLGVDAAGLDDFDRQILRAVCQTFAGGPVGLSTLAAAVGEEADTIEDVYEPYLLQGGYLQRTPRGRAAGPQAWTHLGLEAPGDGSLF
jgi:Holliday junction DNA helicase RuvB